MPQHSAPSAVIGSPVRLNTMPMFRSNTTSTPSATQHLSGLIQSMSANSRSEEHTSELQSLMRISYAVFCLKTKKKSICKNHDRPLPITNTTSHQKDKMTHKKNKNT